MNNQILLSHVAIGPTFRDRLLSNILNNLDSYLLFDNLILTDIKEDFKQLKQYPNIKIEYINDIKKDYPWSIEYESLPVKTSNEEEYAKFIVNNGYKLPSGTFRFGLRYLEYKAIFFLNCDIVCTFTPDSYNKLILNLNKINKDTVIGRNHFFYKNYSNEFNFISQKYDISYTNTSLQSNDGNLFGYIFLNKDKQQKFINLYNKITYSTLIENKDKLWRIGQHGIWGLNSEVIQSFIHNFLDIEVLPLDYIMGEYFKVHTYPEDRFWSWAHGGFKCNLLSKKLFVEENKELLKEFYKERGQIWTYE